MQLRIAGTVGDSIVDGPGFRFSVFTQGCPHGCPGCHNPQTHDFSGGKVVSTDEILEKVFSDPLLDGVTFSGGEPFCQAKALAEMGRAVREKGLNVIVYTGYLWEYLLEHSNENNGYRELIDVADFIVDGRFEQDKKSLALHFRGSSNQRVIDVKESLKQDRVVIAEW